MDIYVSNAGILGPTGGIEIADVERDVEDLVAAAQLGAVEFHTWNSTAKAIKQPDA